MRQAPCVCPSDKGQSRGIAPTLPYIVQRFKTLTTHKYMNGVNQQGWQYFQIRLWQRNYYEHVIRDEADLNRIRAYISANQSRWSSDSENPDNIK
jgi:REP element-mobilizing transposase RayT